MSAKGLMYQVNMNLRVRNEKGGSGGQVRKGVDKGIVKDTEG